MNFGNHRCSQNKFPADTKGWLYLHCLPYKEESLLFSLLFILLFLLNIFFLLQPSYYLLLLLVLLLLLLILFLLLLLLYVLLKKKWFMMLLKTVRQTLFRKGHWIRYRDPCDGVLQWGREGSHRFFFYFNRNNLKTDLKEVNIAVTKILSLTLLRLCSTPFQLGLTLGLPCLPLHCQIWARILLSWFSGNSPSVIPDHPLSTPRWCLKQESY